MNLISKKSKLTVSLLALMLALLSFSACCCNDESEEIKPKYVFYFIADGLGYSHISLTEAYLANSKGKIGAEQLTMTSFPVYGMVNTYSNNRQITGSAAAGTALATGKKENINAIAYFSGEYQDTESILDFFQKEGYKTGLISSVSLNHATPAAFYANSSSRSNYYEIGEQLIGSKIDYLGGGGLRHNMGADNSKTDIFDLLIEDGYNIVNNPDEIKPEYDMVYFVNPVILRSADMPYAIDAEYRGGYSLRDIVKSGIDFLYSENGFFMVIEGGKIDWAAHENDAAALVHDIIDFDNAVKTAFEFYEKHPDQTLIIVTSDHETGGLSLGINKNSYESDFNILNSQKISQEFLKTKVEQKMKTNTINNFSELYDFINDEFYTNDFQMTQKERALLSQAYMHYLTPTMISDEEYKSLYGPYCPVAFTCTRIINNRGSIGFTTTHHTAAAVPIFSIGVGSYSFGGYMDNTEIVEKVLNIFQ